MSPFDYHRSISGPRAYTRPPAKGCRAPTAAAVVCLVAPPPPPFTFFCGGTLRPAMCAAATDTLALTTPLGEQHLDGAHARWGNARRSQKWTQRVERCVEWLAGSVWQAKSRAGGPLAG